MIELRMVEKMVPRQFYKYLKVFEKKKLKRVPTRKTWNHAVDLREGFVPKKEDIPIVKNKERGSTRVCERPVEEEIYLTIKITTDITNILYTKER